MEEKNRAFNFKMYFFVRKIIIIIKWRSINIVHQGCNVMPEWMTEMMLERYKLQATDEEDGRDKWCLLQASVSIHGRNFPFFRSFMKIFFCCCYSMIMTMIMSGEAQICENEIFEQWFLNIFFHPVMKIFLQHIEQHYYLLSHP